MTPRFPQLKGKSLCDEEVLLPSDLEGELNLLAVAFHRGHQKEVDTWIPLFRELESEVPGLAGYEIPTIPDDWRLQCRIPSKLASLKSPEQLPSTNSEFDA